MSRRRKYRLLLFLRGLQVRTARLLTVMLLLAVIPSADLRAKAVTVKQLPQSYRQWLEEDVTYIISQAERKEFLRLTTDNEREKFITAFWEARNPDPHSEINSYKEEHYRRLAYVKSTFGDPRYNDGWRTDMGRAYITLGKPKQTARFHEGIATRPVEIWFYESPSPALPLYFNLVFYRRSYGEEYTFYSPREDGPTRIVTNDIHDDRAALHTIDQSMGAEATHAMVSLLPDEPIDIDNPRPTMASDLLLDAIRNLPEQNLEKQRIAAIRHANVERVTSSIFTGANEAVLDTAVLRDDKGRQTVHFLLRNQRLDPRLVGTLPDQKTGYSMSLQTRVITASGKAIYQQQDTLQGLVSEAGAKAAKDRLFAAEGRLPVVPGSYEIETTLTNNLTHEATRTRKQITVTGVHPESIGMSDLIAYATPGPVTDPDGQLPFTITKLRFTPRGPQAAQIHIGEKLNLAYQIWFPLADVMGAPASTPKMVHVHYLLGSVAGSAGRPPLEEDEDVEVKNLDAAGNLLTGRTLDTSKLEQGTYRLVAKVTEPGTPRSAFATMTVKVLPPEATVSMWTAYGPESLHPLWSEDAQRGVAAEAMGNNAEAEACYRRALALKPDATDIQARLDAVIKKESVHNTAAK